MAQTVDPWTNFSAIASDGGVVSAACSDLQPLAKVNTNSGPPPGWVRQKSRALERSGLTANLPAPTIAAPRSPRANSETTGSSTHQFGRLAAGDGLDSHQCLLCCTAQIGVGRVEASMSVDAPIS